MTGHSSYGTRADMNRREANKNETARLILEERMSTDEIAVRLGLSPRTVRDYRVELVEEGRIPKNVRPKR